MKRRVQPELLDALPPDHPRALRSRADLRRVNRLMRNPDLMIQALAGAWKNGRAAAQITELGAGDGNFLLAVAQKSPAHWPAMTATLLDLQNIVSAKTLSAFATAGWPAKTIVADVFDWPPTAKNGGVVVANLFLHHFEEARLTELMRLIAQRAELFVAVEPRRAAWPLFCSRLLWAIGCNDVTRHDAAVSVQAGFSGKELSALWPEKQNWQLTEHAAGVFSHLFVARKIH